MSSSAFRKTFIVAYSYKDMQLSCLKSKSGAQALSFINPLKNNWGSRHRRNKNKATVPLKCPTASADAVNLVIHGLISHEITY